MSDTTTIKEALERTYATIFPQDDEDALREVVAANVIEHGDGAAPTRIGFDAVAQTMHWIARTFEDRRWTIHRIVAEGDTAVLHSTFSARQVGDLPGLPATGWRFESVQVHIVRFDQGKGIEHWGIRDDASMMRQLTASR